MHYKIHITDRVPLRSVYLFFAGLMMATLLFSCERNECDGLGRNGVCIKVINKSGQPIKKMILTGSAGGKVIQRVLENNAETSISYRSGGESSYRLFVLLENGDTITSHEAYAEGGYSITQTVEKNEIKTSHDSY